MRNAVIYNLQICVDLSDHPTAINSKEARLAFAADMLHGLLADHMQHASPDSTDLIDWKFRDFNEELVSVPDEDEYQEDQAFEEERLVDKLAPVQMSEGQLSCLILMGQ